VTHTVIVSVEARAQLDELYDYVAAAASPATALRFTNDILDQLEGLQDFPSRGTMREDILPGLRTVGFRRRLTVAFVVEPKTVLVLGIYYGGQDFEAILQVE
jgi:toxin ParE1/3/4